MIAALCAVVIGLCNLGCGGGGEDGPELETVTGTVKFDGEPVETGRITFRLTDGDKKAYSGEIAKGEYSVEVPAGSASVQITASRPVPGKFDTSNGEKVPVGEMYIPEEYNSKSTLTETIESGKDPVIPFDLKSK